ncbi:hypothetical protein BMS3Abin04_02621 [bacterium BMS3Abin04]|nr:hypothetical protein BMS3Abin04_02621 [bacterium BMS3Abin04]
MKAFFTFLIILFTSVTYITNAVQPKVKLGIEVLQERNFDILKNKRVGLITNPTGVDSKLRSTIDILFKNINLVALFGPEHGVRGDFEGGAKVKSQIDSITGLPVYSLYGKTREPTKEMLTGIDVLVYDIQDIGSRSYTFISTMGLAMEAAAENNIEFVVLDRPNPLGGNIVEGNLIDEKYKSFVSEFEIPYVYGLTSGELAKLLNEEGMLRNHERCKLIVIPMKNWKRNMTFGETGLLWVPTSPHIPTWETSFFYAMTGIIGELRDAVSIGVGYTLPFKTFATEWIDAQKLSSELNKRHLQGVIFRPIYYKPYYAFGKGSTLKGVQIFITDYHSVKLTQIQFIITELVHKLNPNKNIFSLATKVEVNAFDKVIGTNKIRLEFLKRWKYSDIEPILKKDVDEFKKISSNYYLYN